MPQKLLLENIFESRSESNVFPVFVMKSDSIFTEQFNSNYDTYVHADKHPAQAPTSQLQHAVEKHLTQEASDMEYQPASQQNALGIEPTISIRIRRTLRETILLRVQNARLRLRITRISGRVRLDGWPSAGERACEFSERFESAERGGADVDVG